MNSLKKLFCIFFSEKQENQSFTVYSIGRIYLGKTRNHFPASLHKKFLFFLTASNAVLEPIDVVSDFQKTYRFNLAIK